MYLIENAPRAGTGRLYNKIVLVMRLTAFLLMVGCLQMSANGIAQSVTIVEKNAPLDKIFKQIEKQTSYVFFYDDHILQNAKKVDVNIKNGSVEQVMQACLKDMPLNYQIVGNTIIVVVKGKARAVGEVVQNTDKGLAFIDVRGRVTNENGEPIAGVTVTVKGSKQATSTNSQGDFFIANTDKEAILIFSGSTVETFEVKVAGRTEVMVKLVMKVSKLDEVQVIAYGTTTQRLSTGNINSIKGEEIQKQPINNFLLALEGRVPGLFISQSTGLSGTGVTVRLQGQNSIFGGNDPLYVIDGVPYSSQMLPTTAGGNGGILGKSGDNVYSPGGNGSPLSYINPSDIESVEVLKDADATSIYGSRAANGAILVTTKKGKIGPIKINSNFQYGEGKVSRSTDMMNTQQYILMRKEAFRNDNLFPSANPSAVLPFVYAPDLTIWDTTRFTDWRKVLIGGVAKYANINSTVSGGNAAIQYLVGGTYHRETTVFPGDFSDEKAFVHFNINNVSINKKFHLQLSGSYGYDNNQLPQTDLTVSSYFLPPNAPSLLNPDGSLNWAPNALGTSTWTNPLSINLNRYKNRTNNLISSLILNYKVLPGLELLANIGYSNLGTKESLPIVAVSKPPESRTSSNRQVYLSNSTLNSWIIEPQLIYKTSMSKARIEALVGATIQRNSNEGLYLFGSGYNSDVVVEDIRQASSLTILNSISSIYKYAAAFGRVNFNWNDKYILNLTARRDGSSRFGAQNQFHDFGSVGIAWIFSKESFFERLSNIISFGKLKVSYGTTGNDQIDDYRFMNLYNPNSPTVPYQNTIGLSLNGLPNPYLQWEETKKMSFGIDLSAIKDRILISFSYNLNRSSNQLLQYALPIITGVNSIVDNFPATVQNRTLEFSLNTSNIKRKHFTWNTTFNITSSQNKLISFPTLSTSTYANQLVIGQPANVVKTYHFLGVDPATGLYMVADSRGNPTTTPNSITDKTVFINKNPTIYGGLQNAFIFNRFQLDFLFQFVKQIAPSNILFGLGSYPGNGNRNNQPLYALNRWPNPGQNTDLQKFSSGSGVSIFNQFNNANSSDIAYVDASFIRLKTLSISYDLVKESTTKGVLSSCRVYVQCQNLLTITKYPGLDPETQVYTLPPLRTITAGIQIGF